MEPGERVLGFYRAKVVDNKDEEQYGRVKVWIPALMHSISESEGLWARSANNPVGGRNTKEGQDSYYYGTCYIPRVGSYVWVFFEGGNINRPYYFASLDIETSKVLPENQVGSNPQDKWTPFKTPKGRCIVLSDDPDDERVEITGKKRKLSNPPAGDTSSVYEIDGNQTTILMDERSGKEKILVRTYLGDFINIDVEGRNIEICFLGDVNINCLGSIYLTANGKIQMRAGGGIETETSGDYTVKAKQTKSTSQFSHSISRGWINPLRGVRRVSQPAPAVTNPKPKGDRD
jgi:hypothetical protein